MNSVWWRGVSDAGESDKKSPWVERSRSPSKTSMISISCSQQRWKPLCLYDHPLVNSIKPRNSSTHTPHRRQQLRSEFRHRDLIHLLISRGVFIFWYLISFSLSLFPSSHFYLSRALFLFSPPCSLFMNTMLAAVTEILGVLLLHVLPCKMKYYWLAW